MADKHTAASNLDGSTDVSLADAQSITERNNMTLETEKQIEAGQRDDQTTVHEPVADEKAAVDTALEKADSGDVSDEKKIEIEEEEDEEQVEYPAKWRLALITIALCLSVFCMALVWAPSILRRCATSTNAQLITGQHNYRNRYSSHYRSVQRRERRRLVRCSLSVDHLLFAADLR